MKKHQLIMPLAASALAATLASTNVLAYEAGDFIVRFGTATVDPQESSSDLKLNNTDVANTGVGVDSDTQFGITAEYMITNNIGIELLAATPFQHDLTVDLAGNFNINKADLGSTKHLPPTISVLWHPLDSDSKLQPYVGVGVNYTTFFDESESSAAEGALQANGLQLDDSFGLAFRVGVDYMINDNWLITAGAWHIDIDTDASVNTVAGKVKVSVDIDPMVYMFGLGYKF